MKHAARRPETVQTLNLTGVPETMLWPLWNRANEAKRKDRLIDDPLAIALVSKVDYDFRGHFGSPSVLHPIRARVCDDLIRGYLSRSASPTVIALGEGLETQFWRIGPGAGRWYSVDVAPAIEARGRLLPQPSEITPIARSALDYGWMDEIEAAAPPFISAAGLLMYFKQAEVVSLLQEIARRFEGAEIFFDTIPVSFSRKTIRGLKITKRYTAPPMPWGVNWSKLPAFVREIGDWEARKVQLYVDPFPNRMPLGSLLSKLLPGLRDVFGAALVHLQAREG
jgi:O-methyltransferase involved in polyketide biosynthesis